ncbi:MAG TPA: hypothetical protein VFT87_05180, partial [Candidatus Saccharimonadales bacterium]|nr:hypothetical protein [Candidatus Saccharimonadales bacterium]
MIRIAKFGPFCLKPVNGIELFGWKVITKNRSINCASCWTILAVQPSSNCILHKVAVDISTGIILYALV